MTHGKHDSQIPLKWAQATYNQLINSPMRELKIFDERTGGVQHSSFDNSANAGALYRRLGRRDAGRADGVTNPLIGFQVYPADLELCRRRAWSGPNAFLRNAMAHLWSADGRGGVVRIDPDGSQTLILQDGENTASDFDSRLIQAEGSLPNGLAFDATGRSADRQLGHGAAGADEPGWPAH